LLVFIPVITKLVRTGPISSTLRVQSTVPVFTADLGIEIPPADAPMTMRSKNGPTGAAESWCAGRTIIAFF
jgi:hypothetical protein